jgi:capsular polysaccharide transport system permease protein
MSSVPTAIGLGISPLRSVLKQRSENGAAAVDARRGAGQGAPTRDDTTAREHDLDPTVLAGGRNPLDNADDGSGIDLLRPRFTAKRHQPRRGLWASFLVLVAVPTLIAVIYYVVFAANQYVSSAKFSLRAADHASGDMQSLRDAPSSPAAIAASFVVVDYLTTRQFVDEAEKSVGLRAMFSNSSADFWTRLDPNIPIERLVSYWRDMVSASYDLSTGILSVSVRAFTPQDSLRLANAVVEGSEKIANQLTQKSRQDMLVSAERQLEHAETRFKTAQASISAFRRSDGASDLSKLAVNNADQLARARGELSAMKTEYSYLSSIMTPTAPAIRILGGKLKAKEDQVAELAEAGAQTGSPSANIGAAIARLETLESDRSFAEKNYTAALEAMQRARSSADHQQIYLSAYAKPALAESSQYPNRLGSIGLVAGVALVIWLLTLLLVLGVRDHMR